MSNHNKLWQEIYFLRGQIDSLRWPITCTAENNGYYDLIKNIIERYDAILLQFEDILKNK